MERQIFRCGVVVQLISGVLLALVALPASADSYMVYRVTADSLNVRQRPTTSSPVVGSVQKNERVVGLMPKNGWAMIAHEGVMGYVSIVYLDLIDFIDDGSSDGYGRSGGYGGYEEEEKCGARDASVRIDVSVSDFDCDEGIFSEGFEDCEARFDVTLRSDCDESMRAEVSCTGTVGYETKDGILERSTTETGWESTRLSYGRGSTTVNLAWRFSTIFDPVVSARLKDGSCEVERLRD